MRRRGERSPVSGFWLYSGGSPPKNDTRTQESVHTATARGPNFFSTTLNSAIIKITLSQNTTKSRHLLSGMYPPLPRWATKQCAPRSRSPSASLPSHYPPLSPAHASMRIPHVHHSRSLRQNYIQTPHVTNIAAAPLAAGRCVPARVPAPGWPVRHQRGGTKGVAAFRAPRLEGTLRKPAPTPSVMAQTPTRKRPGCEEETVRSPGRRFRQ